MFERDFMLSVRLNYLHLKFLVRFVQLESLAEPSSEIVSIAEDLLMLVVEATLQRERLSNAGSGIIWKVRRPKSSTTRDSEF
jgi:hypothetical protein